MLHIYANWYYSCIVLIVILIYFMYVGFELTKAQLLLWIYVALSGLYPAFSVFYSANSYLMPIFLTASKLTAAQSLILTFLVPTFMLFTPRSMILALLKLVFLTEALGVLFTGHTIMFGWSSFSSVMLALSVFLFKPHLKRLDLLAVALIVIASAYHLAITTLAIYVFIIVILILKHNKYFGLPLLGLCLIGYLLIDPTEFLTGNGRYLMWSQYLEVWWNSLPKVLGTGFGTWEWIGPQLKGKDFMGFSMLHNDFLQILFEGGIVGLVLFLWVLIEGFYKNRNLYFVLSIGSFCIAMMTYFPLHVIPGQCLALYYFLGEKDV